MTPLILRRMILEAGSAMQDRAVVDELEVARLEHHLQHNVGMVGDGHKGTERGFLFRADGRVAVLHGAAHIAMLEVAVEPAVFVAEARDVADQGRPAHALGVGLRTAQDEALVEFPEQIGAPVQQHVMDGVGAGDQAFAARHRHLQAEHGDDADLPARVGVRSLEAARLITAPLAAVDQNITDVADIAQAVAERALRQLAAEMGAESAEDEAELIVGIAVPVETAEHEEPAAGCDLLPHPRQVVGHRDEREFFTRHRRVISVAAPQPAHRGVDLLERRRQQPHDPVVGLHEALAKPDGPSTRTIWRLECHRRLPQSCRRSLCCIIFAARLPGRMTQVYRGSTPRSLTIRWAITRSSAMNFRKLSSRPRLMWPWHSCHLYYWTSHDGDPHGPMVCRLHLHIHPVDGSPARLQQGVWAGRVPNKTCKISYSVSRRWHQRRACPNRRR